MASRRSLRPPRVPFTRSISVTPEGETPEPLELEAVNLSRGGLFVRSEKAPPQGTKVALELAAGGRYLDFAEGEVAWVCARGTPGFGVRFTHLRPNAQALVEHLVARGGTGEGVEPPRRWKGAAVVALLMLAGGGVLAHRLRRPHEPAKAPVVTMSVPPEPAPLASVPEKKAFPGEFQFILPTGAVSGLRVTIDDKEVAVMPALKKGAVIRNVFNLPHPARLVIDVNGRQPKYSWQLEGTSVVKSVRVGARNHGTRVVVDLPEDGRRARVVIPTS